MKANKRVRFAILLGALASSVAAAPAAPNAGPQPAVAVNPGGGVTDIDGNRYATVVVGKQEWMASNLRVTRLNDGTPIAAVAESQVWGTLMTPALAWHGNEPNGPWAGYGPLYNWYAVGTDKLAPPGWRVPTHEDWTKFFAMMAGADAGGALKANRTEPAPHPRWDRPNEAAADRIGFAALPAGSRSYVGVFDHVGKFGFWWSRTGGNPSHFAWYRGLRYDTGRAFMTTGHKRNGFSVRCVRDVE